MKYQYKIVVMATSTLMTENALNELGAEGWELVCADFELRKYIFKKEYEDNKTEN
jgi:hypothetical protein